MLNKTAFALTLIALAAVPALAGPALQTSAPAAPVRGVWMHPGFFGTDKTAALDKIRSTLDAYEKAGLNTLIMLVKDTSGYVYFKSRTAVMAPGWDWDFLAEFLDEARKRNMQVHPWFCVFHETAIVGKVREHPEWLIQSPRKEFVGSVNPALPAVREYERGLMMEVAARYGAEWIHLDYIRFPCEPAEPFYSYDPETLRLFKEASGVDLAGLKARDSGNMLWNVWLDWNAGCVTQFVRELKESLKAAGRKVRISAAVFPEAANARVFIGQDWAGWAREGLVDMLCPMLYTNHRGFFEKFTQEAVGIGRGLCQVCPGIGLGTSHNQNTPEGMMEQVGMARTLGADGVVFFSSSSLTAPFLERLGAEK